MPDPTVPDDDGLGDLTARLLQSYSRVADGSGPTEAEVLAALGTLKDALNQVLPPGKAAMSDPGFRADLRQAAASLVVVVGQAIRELGEDLADGTGQSDVT